MEIELAALEKNRTWELVTLPPGKQTIASKWFYNIKYLQNGEIDKFKARLVAKGYNQKYGRDFHESFSPVARSVTVRLLIAIAAAQQWELHQIYVNNAYLHGFLEEDIYLAPPQGYSKAKTSQVCKLTKSLYGLKQAGMQWHKELLIKLLAYGFERSAHDYSLFTKNAHESFLALVIYIDDILISGSRPTEIANIKSYLHFFLPSRTWFRPTASQG